MGATAHFPSAPGTAAMRASPQEPPMCPTTSPLPAAAIQGVENAP